jgi:hypothetical protein
MVETIFWWAFFGLSVFGVIRAWRWHDERRCSSGETVSGSYSFERKAIRCKGLRDIECMGRMCRRHCKDLCGARCSHK